MVKGESQAEYLAKLTAHPISYESVARALSTGAYSMTEIAGLLAGRDSHGNTLPRPAYLYALKKYTADESVTRELENLAYIHTIDLAIEKNWRKESWWEEQMTPGKERLRTLSRIALNDSLGYGLCETCGGRQWDYSIIPPVRCDNCCGTGSASPSIKTFAKMYGVTEDEWKRKIDNKYRKIFSMMYGWELIVLGHIADRLWGDE